MPRKGRQKEGTESKQHPVNIDKIIVPSGNPGELPSDLPMKLMVDRVFGQYMDSEFNEITINGLLGHTVSMDFYTKGVGGGTFVEINLYRDPNAILIEVNGEEVHRWVEDETELPLRFSSVLDEERLVGQAFVEQVGLQPGDYVGDGNEIIREDDEALIFDDDDEVLFGEEATLTLEDDDDFIEC